jgi:hypothetical protein
MDGRKGAMRRGMVDAQTDYGWDPPSPNLRRDRLYGTSVTYGPAAKPRAGPTARQTDKRS